MTPSVIAVQVVLPLALLVWLAIVPTGSVLGFALQAAGTGAFLLALRRWRNGRCGLVAAVDL